MRFIGIDPGQKGGIAVLDENTALVWDMPEGAPQIANLLREIKTDDCLAAIEAVHSMPGQGVSSSFKFGMGTGVIHGALAALRMPFVLVTPQRWQKAVFDSAGGDTKVKSLDLARRLFPDVDLHRKCDHGKSDALLIALWLKRTTP
jgi:Holliday junction resolvasome RuvABC endonuclease subunit